METMNDIQQRAFDIWIDSADIDNDFKTISFSKLEKVLKDEGLKASSSSIGRWAIKFKWQEQLEKVITSSIVEGKAKEIVEASSLSENTKKILDDFTANESLKSDSYEILQKQIKHYMNQMEGGKPLSLDNTKIVIKILEITSNREDKLLDRQALLAATKLISPEQVIDELSSVAIDIEVEG